MTQQDIEQLKLEIDHIFESGANEIRIFEMVVRFIDSRNGVNKNFVSTDVGRSASKNVSYRGYKAVLPENVSMNAFKQIVEISSGFDHCIQPFIDLLSSQLKHKQNISR